MLIYPKNAASGRTGRKPGAYFLQVTQAENAGTETLGLGLASQTLQAKGRKNPRAVAPARILSDCECVERRVEETQEGEPDVFSKNNSLCVCSESAFSPSLRYESL